MPVAMLTTCRLATWFTVGAALLAGDPAQLLHDWRPASGRLMTRWAASVRPDAVWPEYPRPTMVRKSWLNLNGLWSYAITPRAESGFAADGGSGPSAATAAATRPSDGRRPAAADGLILVPFPVESALSGVGRALRPDQTLWYWRNFSVPAEWRDRRVVLHFGAVDWHARAFVNGLPIGAHQGGYDAFYFDITAALRDGENELAVAVHDPTDAGGQPRGKQWLRPHGIWYTPTSGIWQTVWLEAVPATAWIRSLRIIPEAAGGRVRVAAECQWHSPGKPGIEVEVRDGDRVVAAVRTNGAHTADLDIPAARRWSPDDPHLYGLRVRFADPPDTDEVESYFGLRDIRVAADEHSVPRLMLNGQPLFQYGPLDQGFWPDGLYTPPSDEAMKFDIEAVRKMGGNMLRKHVKVEPERFYYWCDRLGVLVWQDMPSPFFGDAQHGQTPLSDVWKANFEVELAAMIRQRGNHPSIVMWVPFNEGWGQNDLAWAKQVVEQVKSLDPARLVNNASGWTDMKIGHVHDVHAYPGPAMPTIEHDRAAVLGEFGGLGLPVKGHLWVEKDNWGYVRYGDEHALTDAYVDLLGRIPPLIAQGLSAAVYTQTTDCESEVNGWLTYDRAVFKIDPRRAAQAAAPLYRPAGRLRSIVPTAREARVAWRHTTTRPAEGWQESSFDDSAWQVGPGGFGTEGTPAAVIGTAWSTADIWLRRRFELPAAVPDDLLLAIHHDEDAEVYLNGRKAASLSGYTTSYQLERLDAAARALLRPEGNVLAIHCRQTAGGQFIDAGLTEWMRPAALPP